MKNTNRHMPTANQKQNLRLGMLLTSLIVVLVWSSFFAFCRYDVKHTLRMYSGRQSAVLSLSYLTLNTVHKMSGNFGLRTVESLIKKASNDPEIFARVKEEHDIPVDERMMVGYGNMIITFDGRAALVGGPMEDNFRRSGDSFEPVDAAWGAPLSRLGEKLKEDDKGGKILSQIFTVAGQQYIFTAMRLPGMPRETVVFLYADTDSILRVYGFPERRLGFAIVAMTISALALLCGILLVRGIRHEIRTSAGIESTARELALQIENRILAEAQREELQGRLMQAQKMEAMGVLAGGIAHDFNNMLTIIMGNAELGLMVSKSGSEEKNILQKIMETSIKARTLTRKLLTLSRKEKLNVEPVQLNFVIVEIIGILKRSVDKKVVIEESLKVDIHPVAADVSQLEQAILNIAMNASDAVDSGGTVKLETSEVYMEEARLDTGSGVSPGTFCRVRISDTGEGIPTENLQKIFEPFFTTRSRGRGTGLGLSIAHRIINNHGGFIHVSSEPGSGTSFDIYLPACEKPPMEKSAANEFSAAPAVNAETILVVDDELEVLQVTVDILGAEGYKALGACGGMEAVSVFEANRERIDLVLLDWNMPEMNGTDVYRKLAAIDPDVRVLLISGYSENGKAGELLGEGVKYFLQKPFSVAELQSAIRKTLDGQV